MDLEETKKIIQNKIEADETVREVRSQIKSYIYEKQNLREGFTETFKPLIEAQEAVKTSIDTQQNKLIKQLQDNQLALTEGLDKNRLAITSGFDKIDEVKRWDLSQLPGLEAIEEEEEEEEEEEKEEEEKEEETKKEIIGKIKELQVIVIKKNKVLKKLIEKSKEKFKDGNYDEGIELSVKAKENQESIEDYLKKIKKLKKSLGKLSEEETVERSIPKVSTIRYEKKEMDKYLNNKEAVDLLKFYGLKLPSEYKDKSLEEFQDAFDKGLNETANYKKSLKDIAFYKKDCNTGLILAFPLKGDNAKDTSKDRIREYNIMQIFINNMGKLRNYKQLTGTGIIHFNNPQQLLDRLELLAGSIFAGNNGVKQEFSQISHLLHKLKVITKKQLNDLLKKYILNK